MMKNLNYNYIKKMLGVLLLSSTLLLGGCFGSYVSAPKDTIKVSKELKKATKGKKGAPAEEMPSITVKSDVKSVYVSTKKVLREEFGKDSIVQYRYNPITKQYDTISLISRLWLQPNQEAGAIIANQKKRDKIQALFVYINPKNSDEVEIEIGSYKRKGFLAKDGESILKAIANDIEANNPSASEDDTEETNDDAMMMTSSSESTSDDSDTTIAE